ncbi:YciI family protein [Plantactinospora sp. CA-290183]|uniref:YciI family protein n=1 Tax=Plantactinospora sp. CA-290183 TaxID=3240006 RepID=UPI003D8DBC1A
MIVLELSFTDDPARLAARPAHREQLARLHAEGRLVAAGPWRDDSGALLLFDVDDETAAREIMSADPYYRTPGVTVVGLRHWRPVVGPGDRRPG